MIVKGSVIEIIRDCSPIEGEDLFIGDRLIALQMVTAWCVCEAPEDSQHSEYVLWPLDYRIVTPLELLAEAAE